MRESAPLIAKPCERPAAYLAGAEGEKLLVSVDLIPCLGCETSGDHHCVAEAQERNTKCPTQQRPDKLRVEFGPPQPRQSRRHRAHHRNSLSIEAHAVNERHSEHNSEQGRGPPRQPSLARQNHSDCQHAHGERCQMGLRQLLKKLQKRREEPVRLHPKAKDLADLAEKDVDGHAVEKSHENWLREKIRHKTQPQKTGQDANDSRENCQHHRKRHERIRLERRQWHQRCTDHGTGGSVRIYDKVARGAKDRIHQQREDRRV